MSNRTPMACGTWPSPLSAESAAEGSVTLGFAGAANGVLYWIEGRPAERGRSVLMALDPAGRVFEVNAQDIDVRTRVHEYGGLPWAVVGKSVVVSEQRDQRLRVVHEDGRVDALTPEGCRYADGASTGDAATMVCVREDHRGAGEPRNAIVEIDIGRAGDAGRVLFGDSDFVAAPQVSADGRRLAFISWNHPDMPWDGTLLHVGERTAEGLASRQAIAGGPGESVLEPRWDTDGSLYFLSDRSGWWNLYRWRQGTVEAMTSLDAEIGGPLWRLGLHAYALTGDGRAVLRVNRRTRDSLEVLDLITRTLTPIELPYVSFDSLGMLDANTAFAVASPTDGPAALVTLDLRQRTHRVVRSAGDAPIPCEAVSIGQAIEFATRPGPDGQARTAHAWFYPPQHPECAPLEGEKPPLMVMLHGGPTSHVGPAFKVNVQFWTTRGFAVVDVNYGGSTGFGRAYRERLRGQWGVVDLQDAVAAVDFLCATGQVDARRLCIRGGSAGGFTVLSALAFTDRFAAGINYFGVSELEMLARDTHKLESRYLDGLVAPLPQGIAIYRERSPLHHMGRSRAALITFQGSQDKAVPPQQSRDIVAAAKAAGCPVAYIEFEGEGHGFRQGPNLVRALKSELAFLGRILKFTPHGEMPQVDIDNAP